LGVVDADCYLLIDEWPARHVDPHWNPISLPPAGKTGRGPHAITYTAAHRERPVRARNVSGLALESAVEGGFRSDRRQPDQRRA